MRKKHNKMKKKAVIYAALIVAFELLRSYVSSLPNAESAARFFSVVEIAWAILLGRALSLLIKRKAGGAAESALNVISSLLRKIFRPAFKKIYEYQSRRKRIVKGKDEREFIFSFNAGKKTRLTMPKEKINLSKCRTNAEKIRALYIKLILKMRRKGDEIRLSETPSEIKASLNRDLYLTDAYERIRYGKLEGFLIDDDMVKRCEAETENI